jgi:hypothetical protein
MNHHNLNAYLELVQALLDCPKGEEWNLLQQHEALITPELLKVMHGLAGQLASEGKANAAKFLRQWETQLAHVLQATPQAVNEPTQGRAESYLMLIQNLLECPKGSEPEILAHHPELIDPGLVQIMQQVSAQLAAKGNQEVAIYLKHLAADISHMLQEQDSLRPVTHQPTPSDPTPAPARETQAEQKSSNPDQDTEILQIIAQSLTNLEVLVAQSLQPINPLWYMELLERAYECEWVLSSEQVEQLIGEKPQCPPGQHAFHLNGWTFTKVLPMASHLGWRVGKEAIDLPHAAGNISGDSNVTGNAKVSGNAKVTDQKMTPPSARKR